MTVLARIVCLASIVSAYAPHTVGAQARLPSDSLQHLVERQDHRVSAMVRQYPDSARATLVRLLAHASNTPPAESRAALGTARRLAAAYAAAWDDAFLVRQVARFESWSPTARSTKAAVDSLRVAGGATLGTHGAAAAMRVWRESYRLARSIGDSAGQASALGNIAVAFYREGALDSAEAYLHRSRALAERIGDQRTRLNAMGTLATVARDRNDHAGAKRLYAQTLALRAQIGDDRGAASDENNLGLVAEALGDTAGARRGYEAALARNRAAGRTSVASDNIVNLGNLAVLRGDYATAARQYGEALAIRRAAGERAREAPVLHNLGLLHMRRGDFPSARGVLSAAIAIYDETGPVEAAIVARTDLAQAYGAMGDLQSAVGTLRRAETLATRDSLPGLLAAVTLTRADLAVEFNALAEAQREYAAAAALFASAGDRDAQADAQQGLGLVQLRAGDATGARRTFEAVLQVRASARDRHAVALSQFLVGVAMAEQGDTIAARRQLLIARGALARVGDSVGEAMVLGSLAGMQLRAGNARGAEGTYDRALTLLRKVPAPAAVAELRAGRARALASRGALASAAAELRGVIDITEQVAGSIRLPERRTGYRADKWQAYERLALIERQRGRDDAAFEVSERLRGREMLELLAGGRVPPVVSTDASLVAREQDLRHRIATLERALENRSAGERVRGLSFRADAAEATAPALAAAQQAYAGLLRRLNDDASEYASLVRPTVANARTVAARLAPDEALLEYLVTDSTTLVFVVRRSGVTAYDLRVSRRTLASAIEFTRETISSRAIGGSREPWRAPLERLHRILVEPVERSGALAGARTLLIAPHAELHYLPFAALIAAGGQPRFLVERYIIAYVPSGSLWLRLLDRASPTQAGGVLAFAPRPDALPASRDEVGAIQSIYGRDATVFTGRRATEAAFRTNAPRASIIHFATFGVLNKDNPLFSFVELAGDQGDDGHLAVHEVFGVPLRARLVVLSACQTALASGASADVPAGDDWIGLVRAFLFAGADNVLATLWPVLDSSSALVMGDFYRGLPGRSLPEALALAQRRAIASKSSADPLKWAAYSLVGAAR